VSFDTLFVACGCMLLSCIAVSLVSVGERGRSNIPNDSRRNTLPRSGKVGDNIPVDKRFSGWWNWEMWENGDENPELAMTKVHRSPRIR